MLDGSSDSAKLKIGRIHKLQKRKYARTIAKFNTWRAAPTEVGLYGFADENGAVSKPEEESHMLLPRGFLSYPSDKTAAINIGSATQRWVCSFHLLKVCTIDIQLFNLGW